MYCLSLMGLSKLKRAIFYLTIGTESITQLHKSNSEQSKYGWSHQCHAFARKGTFFLNMSISENLKTELFLQSVFRTTKMYTLSLKKVASWWFYTKPANGFYCTDDNTDGECSIDNDIAADVTVPNDGTWQKGGHSSLYSRNWLLCPFRIM